MNDRRILRDLVIKGRRYSNPAFGRASLFMGCGVQSRAEGCHVYDDQGNQYVDFFDAYGNQAFGYANPRITAALRAQIDSGRTNSCKVFFDEGHAALSEQLATLTGQALRYSYLTNGGAEAVDSALKLARVHTRRPKFITTAGCYHGKTFAALSAMVRPDYEQLYGPLLREFVSVPYGDLHAMEKAIDDQTAAVLLESVLSEAGIFVPTPEYLRGVRRLCDERGALLIMDEIQTGFGRTGRFFGFEHSGITPDIVCIGKSFGGGMMPISAVLASEKVWTGCVIAPLSFGSSLGGNPLACAIGLKTIEIARDPEFLETVTKHGAWVGEQLDMLAKNHPALIKQHRGIGLFHGLELHDPAVAGLVLWLLFEEGVISAFCLGNPFVIRIEPPLVMDRETLEQSMEKLALALRKAQAYLETIPRDSIGHSRFTWTEEVGAPPDALMAILGDHRRFYDVAPVVHHAEPVTTNMFRCRGRLDNLELEWVERLQLERDAQRVTQEATEGDFLAFRRVTAVTPVPGAPARSRLSIDVSWDAGTELFERVLGLRLRYSLEKSVRDGIARLRGAARTTD